jgi:ParB family chromosome partitioning protein
MMAQSTSSPGKSAPKRRLGRGIGSLLSTPVAIQADEIPASTPPAKPPQPAIHDRDVPQQPRNDTGINHIPVTAIHPSPHQPRREFDDESLRQLADSIQSAGLMQPIVVRPAGGEGTYELIAGERRWRASKLANFKNIPAIVRDVDDHTAAEWSLIENLQREDLNPLERAEAFAHLADQFALTHQDIADRVGLDRSTVANHFRLLTLDEETRTAVASGTLTMGHAKALLSIVNLSTRAALARQCIGQGWSVRELERRARHAVAAADGAGAPLGGTAKAAHPHLVDLERRLGTHLGTKVHVQQHKKKGSGRLTIEFYNLEQFEGLMQRLGFPLDEI